MITTETGLQFEDTAVGSGPEAVAGKSVEVHYTGTLADGTKFDSSHDRKKPFSFRLGGKQVIAGWDEGVAGMKVGGTWTPAIPATSPMGARCPRRDSPERAAHVRCGIASRHVKQSGDRLPCRRNGSSPAVCAWC